MSRLSVTLALVLAGCPGGLPTESGACGEAGCEPQPDLYPSASENSSYLPPAWYDAGIGTGDATSGKQADASEAAAPPKPDTLDQGRWYQANQQVCATFCTTQGKASVAGPEGAHCMSGEVRSASGIMQGIVFPWGCYPDCLGDGPHLATSSGGFCYKPGQKHDNDSTDRTVGCFCR